MMALDFREKLIERMWKIEGLISEEKNQHCLSRAKYRGLMKTQIRAYMAASVLNMKRLVAFYIFSLIYIRILQLFNKSNFKFNY
jgi:hypothetical protein